MFNVKEIMTIISNNRIVKITSVLVMVYYFLVTISMISSSTLISLSDKYNQYELMLESLSFVFYSHSSLIMVPLFLMFILLFTKRLTLFYVALAFILSFSFNSYHYLDETIHPIITSFGLYDSLLRDNQTVLNPQYTKLFLYIILIAIFIVLAFIKKQRSLDRIFVLLISSSVLITTMFFHFAFPMGMFKYIKEKEEITLLESVRNLTIEKLCESRNCFILDDKGNVDTVLNDSNKELLNRYSYYIEHVLSNDKHVPNGEKVVYRTSLGDFSGLRFDYIITVVSPLFDDNSLYYLVVMDTEVLKKTSRHSEIWFSYLTSVAHTVWIFGGILLLFFHKRRFSKRNKEQLLNVNNA